MSALAVSSTTLHIGVVELLGSVMMRTLNSGNVLRQQVGRHLPFSGTWVFGWAVAHILIPRGVGAMAGRHALDTPNFLYPA